MNKKIAFVFPGQGSQSLGMLNELAGQFSVIQETFDEASDALSFDLWALVQQGPVELLNQTTNTQPAILAASVALWRIWQQKQGINPVVLAGHSLGEYSALVCASALDFATAIRLVALRGKFMQEAVPEGTGAMAAIIGLDNVLVDQICVEAAHEAILSPANFNAIGQIVIAGEQTAVERAIKLAEEAGAKLAKMIPVSVPSHCALMKPAAERLAETLVNIHLNPPKVPIINNVEVAIENDINRIKSALISQLYSPVRWVETVQTMIQQNIKLFVECGPGKVLAGLNKRIDATVPNITIGDLTGLEAALDSCSKLENYAI